MPRPSSWISEPYEIYHVGMFNAFYDTVNPSVESWELGASLTQSHNPHEREKHGGIELCDGVKASFFTLSHDCVFAKRWPYWGIESCDCVNGVKAARSPSVEFSSIANRSGRVKPVKLVKKLRGGALGVELGVTVLVNYIVSGVIHNSFYKGQYDMQLVNNLLNFTARGWWA